MRSIFIFALALLAGCARTETIRTSANSFILQTVAPADCGAVGAARVASQMAAVETIRAGFDRYIIIGGQASNNVTYVQSPAVTYTERTPSNGRDRGSETTTYVPATTSAVGTHDQELSVVMFRNGDPDGQNAISARDALGPDWADKVKDGVRRCL